MLVWGGGEAPFLDTGGSYDPVADTWTPTATTNAPSPRSSHLAVWTGSLMVVWGGYADPVAGALDTGGRYDPLTDTWTPTYSTGSPSRRHGHTAVWTGNQMIVWGGGPGGYYLDTGGRYNLATDSWTPTSSVDVPSPRIGHTAVWTGSHMIV